MNKRTILKNLQDIKEDIPNNSNLTNYNKIYNACVEIDCNVSGLDLTDYIYEQNFIVSEEDEKIAIENNSDSIDRLRCFVGDTYSDDVYCLEGYGNLKNVNDGDFETLCEDLARIVEQQLDKQEEM